MVDDSVCSVPVSLFSREVWLPQLPQGSVSRLCWPNSAVSCRCMQSTVSGQIGNHAKQYPACNYWKRSRIAGFIRRRCLLLSKWHKVSSQKSYAIFLGPTFLHRGYMSIYWRPPHQKKNVFSPVSWGGQVSLSVQNQGAAVQANWMLCLCPPCLKTLSSGWISLKTSRQMAQTNSRPVSMPPHVGTQAPDWNHSHGSDLVFGDGSRVSPQNFNGRARMLPCVVGKLVNSCVQETGWSEW